MRAGELTAAGPAERSDARLMVAAGVAVVAVAAGAVLFDASQYVIPLAVLIGGFLVGVPIAFSLMASGMLGIWLTAGDWEVVSGVLRTAPYSTLADYNLTAIPMFILMAYLIARSGVARDLYEAASKWTARLPGGLAISTVLASMVFGAMSGVSVAGAAVMAGIAMPNMRRFGYADRVGGGAVAVGSTLAVLIPPSVGMIVYGVATETSIGQLLIAGVMPGLLLGGLLMLTIVAWAAARPTLAPKGEAVSWRERWVSLLRVWPTVVLIAALLVMLYLGLATPTEVGGLGALGAALLGFGMRRLSLREAKEAGNDAICASAMIFAIIVGAHIFSTYMALSGIPQAAVEAVADAELNRWIVLAGIAVGYFVISMFMDENPLLLLTLPLTFPVITALGFDPVWFGVVSMLLVAMGLVFPPVGLAAFVVSSAGNVELTQVYRGTVVLLLPIVVTLILVLIFPEIALWLPSLAQR